MNKIPAEIWQEACGFAEQAVRVKTVYEDRAMYFIEPCQRFLIASVNAGVKEIAERFIAKAVEESFASEFLNQTLLQVQAQKQREQGAKLND